VTADTDDVEGQFGPAIQVQEMPACGKVLGIGVEEQLIRHRLAHDPSPVDQHVEQQFIFPHLVEIDPQRVLG